MFGAVSAVVAFAGGGVLVASAAGGSPSSFVPTAPLRVLDTRQPSSPIQTLGPNATVTLSLAAHVPADTTAVALNVTATEGSTTSFLTVYPTGSALPNASSVNWNNPAAHPNAVIVQLGTNRSININNAFGTVDVIVDLNGYYVPATGGGPPASTPSAGNWGVIDRNTLGSPSAELRSGPFQPPLGNGSLNLTVGSATEKITWGNEMDFVNKPFDITAVGFYVFNLGENISKGHNMPAIAFEIRPHLAAFPTATFSTLSWFPGNTAPGWSNFIDATQTGVWGLSGSEFDGVPCGINNSGCSWAELQVFLNDADGVPPQMLTVAITKGRDLEWHGAVDGLKIGATVYDFEEHGVTATPA